MDILKKQEENFILFENFINGLSDKDAKAFIIEFFKHYKYLLKEDIIRITDSILIKSLNIKKENK